MKKSMLALLVILWLPLVMMWCSQQKDTHMAGDVEKNVQKIKIGVIAPLSWPAATFGEDAINAIEDGLSTFSSDSVEIELVVEDGKCGAKDSVAAVQKLINADKVNFIIGGACSGETTAAGKIAQQQNVLMLSPTASAPDISNIGDYVFRFWNDAHASVTWAWYLNKKFDRIALLVENTDYAQWIAQKLSSLYDGEIVLERNFGSEEKDFAILAKQIAQKQWSIDGIVLINQSEASGANVIKAFEWEWLLNAYKGKIMGAYLFSSQTFLDAVGDLSEWLVELQLAPLDTMWASAQSYMDEFEGKYGMKSIPLAVLLPREAIGLYLDGIQAWHYDTESMKEYMKTITESSPREWYFGSYYFDQYGDAIWLEYMVQEIRDGEWVMIEQ